MLQGQAVPRERPFNSAAGKSLDAAGYRGLGRRTGVECPVEELRRRGWTDRPWLEKKPLIWVDIPSGVQISLWRMASRSEPVSP